MKRDPKCTDTFEINFTVNFLVRNVISVSHNLISFLILSKKVPMQMYKILMLCVAL
jgi:hypothetical protein